MRPALSRLGRKYERMATIGLCNGGDARVIETGVHPRCVPDRGDYVAGCGMTTENGAPEPCGIAGSEQEGSRPVEGVEGTVIAPRKARAPGFRRFGKPARDPVIVGNERLNGERLGRAFERHQRFLACKQRNPLARVDEAGPDDERRQVAVEPIHAEDRRMRPLLVQERLERRIIQHRARRRNRGRRGRVDAHPGSHSRSLRGRSKSLRRVEAVRKLSRLCNSNLNRIPVRAVALNGCHGSPGLGQYVDRCRDASSAQAFQHETDLLFRRVLFAGGAAIVFDELLRQRLLWPSAR